MKKILSPLLFAIAIACSVQAKADIYTYDANISGFDNQNVFTHVFNLGPVQEILEVSIDLIHTRATDIDFTLTAPGGFNTFVLTTDNGSTSDLNGTYRFVRIFGPNGGNGLWPNLGPDVTIPSGYYDAESWITPSNGWGAGAWTLTLNDDLTGESGSVGAVSVTYSKAVPEPSSTLLMIGAGIAFLIRRRR